MAEKTQQEIITLRGKLKKDIAPGISSKGDDYFSVPLEVKETEKNERIVDNEFESIMLVFWKKEFNDSTKNNISNLKENQNIAVSGYLTGPEKTLLKVTELVDEEVIFI